MTNNYTSVPLDAKPLRTILLRMKEIRRCVIALDETIGGSKYHVDSDEQAEDAQSNASSIQESAS